VVYHFTGMAYPSYEEILSTPAPKNRGRKKIQHY
jgi:hypothetical protein